MAAAAPRDDRKTTEFNDIVQNVMQLLESTGNQSGWEQAWQKEWTPWEMMMADSDLEQPSLNWAFKIDDGVKALMPSGGTALVPGCGRGQDVSFLANQGYEAIGLDISPSAVAAAQAWLKKANNASSGHASNGKVRFMVADYFDLSKGPVADFLKNKVDLVYDYTFFCAIPPELHQKWAEAHAAVIRPGGILLALVFPLRPAGNTSTKGPPYLVTTAQYSELLSKHFELKLEKVPSNLPANKVGRELVQVWQRK